MINNHWQSINNSSTYPFDDTATMVDDSGMQLANSVISDLNLCWPRVYGDVAYLSALTLSPRLINLIFCVTASANPTNVRVLCTFTKLLPLISDNVYNLESRIDDNFTGTITFGSAVRSLVSLVSYRFSSVNQTRIAGRASYVLPTLPIRSVRNFASQKSLSGLIKLTAQPPLHIAAEYREIDGLTQRAIVFRLIDDAVVDSNIPSAFASVVNTRNESLFVQYAGPCGRRPESKNCGDPQPIEFLNNVGPACDGTLTLRFSGCAVASQIDSVCGVVLDCDTQLEATCPPKYLPDSDGILPYEYGPVIIPPSSDSVSTSDGDSFSESIGDPTVTLPWVTCFAGAVSPLTVAVGSFNVVADTTDENQVCNPVLADAPFVPELNSTFVYSSTTTLGRNVSVWHGGDTTTLNREVTANVKIVQRDVGARQNASVIVNYRPHATIAGQFVYFLAEIDFDTQAVRLARYNGTIFQTIVESIVPGITTGVWYRIEVRVVKISNTQVSLRAKFNSLEDSVLDVTIGPTLINSYFPSTGAFGVGTDRSISRFSFLHVAELP